MPPTTTTTTPSGAGVPPELQALFERLGVDPSGSGGYDDPFVGDTDLDVVVGRRPNDRSTGRAIGDVGYKPGTSVPETKKQSELLKELFASDDPAEIMSLQQRLYDAGFFGDTPRNAISWGVVDDRTARAYEAALTRAALFNRAGRDITLDEMLAESVGVAAGEGRIIGGRVGGGNVYGVTLSDPDTLNATADKVAQAVLGRKATDEERAKVVAALQAEEQSTQRTVNTAREGQARTEFDAALGAERGEALVATGGAIISPVPGAAVTDTMGADRDDGKRKHKGTDLFGEKGSPAVAPIGGTVVKAGNSGGNGGLRVWIQGDDGRFHYLAHLDRIDVKQGQRIEQGAPIGTVGNTGNATSTAPHVHYSINSSPSTEDAVGNPALELRGSAGGAGAVRTAPSTYIPPVTTTVQEVDPVASAERMLREQNPSEAQAHDLANQFSTFIDMLRAPV